MSDVYIYSVEIKRISELYSCSTNVPTNCLTSIWTKKVLQQVPAVLSSPVSTACDALSFLLWEVLGAQV